MTVTISTTIQTLIDLSPTTLTQFILIGSMIRAKYFCVHLNSFYEVRPHSCPIQWRPVETILSLTTLVQFLLVHLVIINSLTKMMVS